MCTKAARRRPFEELANTNIVLDQQNCIVNTAWLKSVPLWNHCCWKSAEKRRKVIISRTYKPCAERKLSDNKRNATKRLLRTHFPVRRPLGFIVIPFNAAHITRFGKQSCTERASLSWNQGLSFSYSQSISSRVRSHSGFVGKSVPDHCLQQSMRSLRTASFVLNWSVPTISSFHTHHRCV